MAELLAPAGNIEAFKAAISNGCDAVYLGMQKFGARAYSSNFDIESLEEAIKYAHLRDVKVYVTMNTIVFEEEIEEMKQMLHKLNEIGVDGVIVQDLAVLDYVVNNFSNMEAHCSTQMGIDDLEGTLMCKELGANRVVLAREVPIDKVKEIRKIAKIPIEIFVHGALCVSYSGNCLMSGLIGYRSGNRGRCVGSCRKKYKLVDKTNDTIISDNYILSTKDLNTIDYINDLKEIDSLKIEGRMKEPSYVANVVSKYRKALDSSIDYKDKEDLLKTFNRTYTKGYLFKEDKKDITNVLRPNNYGFEIGKITKYYKGMYEIRLNKNAILNQNDIIRIDHNNEDVNLSVVKIYDKNSNLVNKSTDICYIKVKEQLSVGDIVYKTKDVLYHKELDEIIEKEFKRFDLDIKVYACPNSHLIIDASGFGLNYLYESEEVLSEALNNPTDKNQVIKSFSKLNDTVFKLGSVEYEDYNAFIPAKLLNNARREIVNNLYNLKIKSKKKELKQSNITDMISYESKEPYLTAYVSNKEQYDACVESGINEIYYDNVISDIKGNVTGNVIRRNQNDYKEKDENQTLLIGGFGGLYKYRKTNPFVTDYSFNVVNSDSVYKLHQLGAKRVTLSYEINSTQIDDLIDAYFDQNNGYPSLEMIVYGHSPLMFTKYCPMKKMNQCGICKTKKYELKDEIGAFPIISHNDCTTTILNGKILNLLDEIPYLNGIEAFRLNFTIESKEEVIKIINNAKGKLNDTLDKQLFNKETDTRGHFNKEIM